MRFVLASQSPARLATLRAAGVDPEVIVSGVDEDALTAPSTPELVAVLAAAKARAVASTSTPSASPDGGANDADGVEVEGALVLGCDSMLDLDGTALGKPGSADAAAQRWRTMRGRTGTLWTGHHLIDTAAGRETSRAVGTIVRFADATDAEIDAYAHSGEPANVAGAFTIDGLGGWLVTSVEGDHHNVVGVSLPAVRELLQELGHSLADLGWPGASKGWNG